MSTTSRQYLSGNLSVTKMYDMYVKEIPNPESLTTYRHVFNSEFNLAFYVPKKDECQTAQPLTMPHKVKKKA